MFTGIIRAIGRVSGFRRTRSGARVEIEGDLGPFPEGASIAVNGVCLTALEEDLLRFDVIPETLSRTNLGALRKGDRVNLEPALRSGEAVSGHLVQGHVDGTGRVVSLRRGRSVTLRVDVDPSLASRLQPKGSVAIDGVSLTVVEVAHDSFTTALIPYTLRHTTLGRRKKGDRINIETDHSVAGPLKRRGGVTKALLREAGFA